MRRTGLRFTHCRIIRRMGNQKAPEGDVVRDPGISDSPEEDGVMPLDVFDTVIGHELARLQVAITTPVLLVPVQ